jgi:FkbM family methyltransferase
MLPKTKILKIDGLLYLVFDNKDIITQSLLSGNDFCAVEKKICREFIKDKKSPVILDMGANFGMFSIGMAKEIQNTEGGELLAFEPQRVIFQQLCANVVLNSLDNVRTYNIAVGSARGTLHLPRLDLSSSTNPGGFSVDADIRDNLLSEYENGRTAKNFYLPNSFDTVDLLPLDEIDTIRNINFIKLDVEGFELDVLKGAVETLKRSGHPPIVFEDWGDKFAWYKDKSRATVSFIESLGYKISRIENRNYLAQR